MENILQIENLSVLIKERFLVKNVSLSVQKGEAVALIGEDKSGKTSLIKAISGSLPISKGNIFVDGKDITVDKSELSNVGISLDPPVFFKYQSVYDNLKYLTRLSDRNSKEEILSALDQFGLTSSLKVKVVFLNYYEKKLMSLALAFLTQPKILLLDEPFKNMTDEMVLNIKNHIKNLQKQGTTIIISSTNIENVEDVCSRFVFMVDREIKNILDNQQCVNYLTEKEWAYISVKYPHYCGKILIDELSLNVKLLKNKILFQGDAALTTRVVKYITSKGIRIFGAGFISSKSERLISELSPYFKEEK